MLTGSLFGIAGLYVMYFIENGEFGGISFFGAFFFGPIGVLLSSYLVKLSKDAIEYMMDIAVPAVCIALCVNKVNCAISGCCRGYIMTVLENGQKVRFPSQLVESGVALLTMLLFIWFIRKGLLKGHLYALYMVVYGVERFILTFFRDNSQITGLPMGQIWSLVSFVIGASYLYIRYLRRNAEREKERMKTNRASHKAHR